MKQSTIQIHDARRKGGVGYRVKSVAKNGEILQVSEVLESEKAVQKHLEAMAMCWSPKRPKEAQKIDFLRVILDFIDHTKTKVFVNKGWAKAAKK